MAEESNTPWYRPGESLISESSRNASISKTRDYLRIYNRDIPHWKFLVKLARGAQSSVPSAQWEHIHDILRGEPIELEQFIFLSFLPGMKRHIVTAFDWSVAWKLAAKATAFVFPHRARELHAYGDYIKNLHPKILV